MISLEGNLSTYDFNIFQSDSQSRSNWNIKGEYSRIFSLKSTILKIRLILKGRRSTLIFPCVPIKVCECDCVCCGAHAGLRLMSSSLSLRRGLWGLRGSSSPVSCLSRSASTQLWGAIIFLGPNGGGPSKASMSS